MISVITIAVGNVNLVSLNTSKLVSRRTYKKKLQRPSYPSQTRVQFTMLALHNWNVKVAYFFGSDE